MIMSLELMKYYYYFEAMFLCYYVKRGTCANGHMR